MPVKDLISLMRKSNVLVHVDGAHAPGHIKIDLEELDPDFYVGWCLFYIIYPDVLVLTAKIQVLISV